MKKVSTVARKQSRNIFQQKLTIGLDFWEIATVGTGWWMKQARYSWSSVRMSAQAWQKVFGRDAAQSDRDDHDAVRDQIAAGAIVQQRATFIGECIRKYTGSKP